MYGYNIDQEMILSDGIALPNATSGDSTNMVNIGGQTGQKLVISVYAKTGVTVATGKAMFIEIQAFTTDTAASAVSPIANAHVYAIHKTTADAELAIAAGALICEYAIPEQMFANSSYDWVQLLITTDEDLSAMTYDAFVRVEV